MSIIFVENQTTKKDFQLVSAGEGVYTCAIYYCYLEGYEGSTAPNEWHSNWSEWCRWIAEYETNLIVDYIKSQGLAADMPILSIEKVAVPPKYVKNGSLNQGIFLQEVIAKLPNFNSVNLHLCIGENNFQTGPISLWNGTVMMRAGILEQEIGAMENTPFYQTHPGLVYCELAHELGHNFGLSHCGAQNKPCPMAQMQITYDEWVSMGKVLWFCDISRPILLANWESRNLI